MNPSFPPVDEEVVMKDFTWFNELGTQLFSALTWSNVRREADELDPIYEEMWHAK